MSITFNPFTGNLDFVGGASVTTWKTPVANAAALPTVGNSDGDARVTLDTDEIWVWDAAGARWENQQIQAASVGAVPNAQGYSISINETVADLRTNELVLQPADGSNPGVLSTSAQNIAGNKTFDNDVIVTGDLTVNGTTTTINTTNLEVEDQNILINNNGNDISAEGAGLTVERTSTDGSLAYEDALASKWKAGALGSEVELTNVSSAQTLTNKSIDADNNTITNIDNADIKAGAAIDATKIHDGSVDNTEFGHLDGVSSNIQTQLDDKVDGPASATDSALALYDGTTGKLVKNSALTVSGTTLSAGASDLILDGVDVDANSNVIKNVTDPSNAQDAATKNYVDTQDANKADTDLNNLVTTSINQDLLPDASGTRDLGSFSLRWGQITGGTGFFQTVVQNTAGQGIIEMSDTDNYTSTTGLGIPSQGAAGLAFWGASNNIDLNVFTKSLNDAAPGGNLYLYTGDNANGNSGNVIIGTGTSPMTRGEIQLNATEVNISSNLDMNTNTITNVVDPSNAQDAATKAYVDANTSFEPGDLDQVDFSMANNQASFADVTGVSFANGTVRSAELQYSVEIDATADLYESGKIFAVQRGADWSISHTANGDNSQVLFNMTASGQLQYTSANYAGFVSGTIKVRAITTSI